jgi:two-component system, NarL family, response regulator LiaR
MIKIAICDDQEVVCQGLSAILSTSKDLQVIGISNNGQELLEFLDRKPADVVLMDLKMPILNGIQATKLIKENNPEIKILVLTTYDADNWLFDAIRNGADGYLLKDTSRENLILAIHEVFEGKTPVDTKIAGRLFEKISKTHDPETTTMGKDLSKREMQILRCLSHGLSNAEISRELYLSEGTVRNYVSGILEKLEVEDRTQAAVLALRYGLVD